MVVGAQSASGTEKKEPRGTSPKHREPHHGQQQAEAQQTDKPDKHHGAPVKAPLRPLFLLLLCSGERMTGVKLRGANGQVEEVKVVVYADDMVVMAPVRSSYSTTWGDWRRRWQRWA